MIGVIGGRGLYFKRKIEHENQLINLTKKMKLKEA